MPYSFTNRPLCAKSREIMDDRLFAHIHLDSSISGTHLEGDQFKRTTRYIEEILDYLRKNDLNLSAEKKAKLEFALKNSEEEFKILRDIEMEIGKKIQEVANLGKEKPYPTKEELHSQHIKPLGDYIFNKLETNSSILIPGGWKGAAGEHGHAMCYRIQKNEDGSYLFIVYNTGAGIRHHLKTTQYNDTYSPIKSFRIPPQKNKEGLRDFITGLMEPKIKPVCEDLSIPPIYDIYKQQMVEDFEAHQKWKTEERVYDGNRVYGEIIANIGYLGAEELDPSKISPITTRGQLGGSCSFRVLMPLLHTLLKGEVFSEVLYQLRLQSIIDYFSIEKEHKNLSHPTVQRNLNKSIQQLAKTTQKFMKRKIKKVPILSEEAGLATLDFLDQLKQELALHKKSKTAKAEEPLRLAQPLPNDQSTTTMTVGSLSDKTLFSDKQLALPVPKVKAEAEKITLKTKQELPDKRNYSNPKDYFKAIHEVLAYNDSLGLAEVIIQDIEKLFLEMPLDFKENQEYWKALKQEDASLTLTALQEIIRLYGKHCHFVSPYPMPKQIITSNTALYFSSFIMQRHFEKYDNMGNLSGLFPGALTLNDIETTSLDPVYDQRMIELNEAMEILKKTEKQKDEVIDSDLGMRDYYDLIFLKEVLDTQELKILGDSIKNKFCRDTIDNARQNLYSLIKSKGPISENLKPIIAKYQTYLQFRQFLQENKLFQEGQYQYFEKSIGSLVNVDGLRVEEGNFRRATKPFVYRTNRTYGYNIKTDAEKNSLRDFLGFEESKVKKGGGFTPGKRTAVSEILFSYKPQTDITSNLAIKTAFETSYGSLELPLSHPKRALAMLRLVHENKAILTKEFFETNPELLEDKDYQTLMLINFFGLNLQDKDKTLRQSSFELTLKRNAGFAKEMFKFISKNLKHHTRKDEITPGGLFCYQLSYNLLKYLKNYQKNHESKEISETIQLLEQLDGQLEETIDQYRKKLMDPKISALHSKTYQELLNINFMRHVVIGKESPKEKIKNLFESAMRNKLAGGADNLNKYFYSDYQATLFSNKKLLKHYFDSLTDPEKIQMITELIENSLVPDVVSQPFTLKIDYPAVLIQDKTREIWFDLEQGSVSALGIRVGKLPGEFYQKEFINLFGSRSRTGIIHEDINTIMCEFQENNKQYRGIYSKSERKLLIQIAYGKPPEWYQLTRYSEPTKDFSLIPALPSFVATQSDHVWWASLDKKPETKFLCTDQNNDFLYHVEMSQDKASLAEYRTNIRRYVPYVCYQLDKEGERNQITLLSKTTPNSKKIYELFSNFENIDNIEIWQKTKKEVLEGFIVKLPRYNIEFLSRQRVDGSIEFYLKDKPHLVLSDKTALDPFVNCLYLENTKNKEMTVLIPNKEFYAIDNENVTPKPDEFYPLVYDTGDLVADKVLQRSWFSRDLRWDITGNEPFAQYKIKDNELIPNTPEEALQLAYIYLGTKDTERALNMLKKCYELGGIQGSLQEVLFIKKIMEGIPNQLVAGKTLYDKARIIDAETVAIRLWAASLLSDSKIRYFNKPNFDFLPRRDHNSFLTKNEAYQYSLHKEAEEFYKYGFHNAIYEAYEGYFSRSELIPYEYRLSPDRCLSLLQNIGGRLSGSLGNHYNELELIQLSKEKEILIKKRAIQGLSKPEDARLQELSDLIKKQNKFSSSQQKLVEKEIRIEPGKIFGFYSFLNPWESEKEKFAYKKHVYFDKPLPHDLKIIDILKNFDQIYRRLTSEVYRDRSSEIASFKKELLEYLEKVLAAVPLLNRMGNLKPKDDAGVKACGLLYYVLKFPDAPWPELAFDDKGKELSMGKIVQFVKSLENQTPLFIKSIDVEAKPGAIKKKKITKKLSAQSLNPKTTDNSHFNLMQTLNLTEYKKALNVLVFIPQDRLFNPFKVDKKTLDEPNKDLFKEKQKTQFLEDLKKGTEANIKIQFDREVHKKYLADTIVRSHIEKEIFEKKQQSEEIIKHQLLGLMELSNRALIGSDATLETRSAILSKQINPLKLNDLIGLYLQQDISLFQQRTKLKPEQCVELYQKIHEYLLEKTKNQLFSKTLNSLVEIKALTPGTDEFDAKLVQLGEQVSTQRNFDAEVHPELLVFEYYEDINIRSPQVKMLQELIERDGEGFSPQVLQLIMGGGKSKVLLPLLALLKAKGNNLSIIEVPASLFQTNLAELQATTQRLFGKMGHPFTFNRDIDCNALYLKRMLNKLNQVILDREYIICTSESIQSLELKYLELLGSESDESKKEQILYLEKILNVFKTKGDAIIDEGHDVLDSKRELNYTQKDKQSIDKSITESILKINRLFDKTIVPLVSGPVTLKKLMLEGENIPTAAIITETLNNLANNLIHEPTSPLFAYAKSLSELNQQALFQFILNNSNEVPDFIVDDQKTNYESKELISLAKGQLEFYKSSLSLRPNEHYGFPRSATYPGYKEIAIPYLANNTPNEKAQFASIYEVINFTIQLQKQKMFLSESLIKEFIAEFQNRAHATGEPDISITEAAIEFHALTGLALEKINLKNLKDVLDAQRSLSNNEDVQDYILKHYIIPEIVDYPEILKSNSINHISQFRSAQVITGTPWNEESYSFNFKKFPLNSIAIETECNLKTVADLESQIPLLIKDSMGEIWIYGRGKQNEPKLTLLNKDLYQAIPFEKTLSQISSLQISAEIWNELYKKEAHHKLKALGTDGQTIELLHRKNPTINILSTVEPESMVKKLILEHPKSENLHAIIDIGALFQGVTNFDVACLLARTLSQRKDNTITHILYFNEDNVLAALPFECPLDENTNLPTLKIGKSIVIGSTDPKVIAERTGSSLDNCFTYYDQRHITGTDIKQSKDAIGIATVGTHTTARSFWQGVMRFRQFNENQMIDVAIPKAVADLKPTLQYQIDDIIALVEDNQEEILSEVNLSSSLSKMHNVIRAELLNQIYEAKTVDEKTRLRKVFNDFFTTKNIKDPLLKFANVNPLTPTSKILEDYLQKACLEPYKTLMNLAYPNQPLIPNINNIQYELETIKLMALSVCRDNYKHVIGREFGATAEVQRVASDVQSQASEISLAQKQSQTQQQSLAQKQAISSTSPVKPYIPWKDIFPTKISLENATGPKITLLNDMLLSTHQPNWRFSNNIFVSENYAGTLTEQHKKMDQYIKPVNFFMTVQEPGSAQLKTMIITQEEAIEFSKYLNTHSEELIKAGFRVWINTPSNFLFSGTSQEPPPPAYLTILEEIRFFNADIDKIVDDKNIDWMLESFNEKFEFLQNNLLVNHPEKAKFFAHARHQFTKLVDKMIMDEKINMEELFEAIRKNNAKVFEQTLTMINKVENESLKTAIYNSLSRRDKHSLLTTAIEAKNINFVERLLQNINKFYYLNAKENYLISAMKHYRTDIYKMLTSNSKIMPDKLENKTWTAIFNEAWSTQNEELIILTMKAMRNYCNSDLINQLIDDKLNSLLRGAPENIVPTLTLLSHLTLEEHEVWRRFILKTSTPMLAEECKKLLNAWITKPPNIAVQNYLKGKFNLKDSSLLLDLFQQKSNLAESLIFDPAFTIPSEDEESWLSLLRFNENWALFFKPQEKQDKVDYSNQMLSLKGFPDLLKELLNKAEVSKKETSILKNKEATQLLTFLENYPKKENAELWNMINDSFPLETIDRTNTINLLDSIYFSIQKRSLNEIRSFLELMIPKLMNANTMDVLQKFVSLMDFKEEKYLEMGQKILALALQNKNVDLIEQLSKQGFPLTDPVQNESLLAMAVDAKKHDLARNLLLLHVNPNIKASNDKYLICNAINNEDLKMIEILLQFNVDLSVKSIINVQYTEPITAVQHALGFYTKESLNLGKNILKMLGDTGAFEYPYRITYESIFYNFGNYLLFSLKNNNRSSLSAIKHIKQFDSRPGMMNSVIEELVKSKSIDSLMLFFEYFPEEIKNYLPRLMYSIDVDARVLALAWVKELIQTGDMESVENLFKLFPSVKKMFFEPEFPEMPPLQTAIQANNSGFVADLVKLGAPLNSKDLFEAIHTKRTPEIIQAILFAGVDPNAQDPEGNTPLSLALSSGQLHIAELLIENNADANLIDKTKFPALPTLFSATTPRSKALKQSKLKSKRNLLYGFKEKEKLAGKVKADSDQTQIELDDSNGPEEPEL